MRRLFRGRHGAGDGSGLMSSASCACPLCPASGPCVVACSPRGVSRGSSWRVRRRAADAGLDAPKITSPARPHRPVGHHPHRRPPRRRAAGRAAAGRVLHRQAAPGRRYDGPPVRGALDRRQPVRAARNLGSRRASFRRRAHRHGGPRAAARRRGRRSHERRRRGLGRRCQRPIHSQPDRIRLSAVRKRRGDRQIDVVSQRREPALFVLLVDSSQSMALRYDAVRAAARRFLEPLHPDDVIIVAPFSRAVTTVTGPTRDHATIIDAIGAIKPSGGTAILDALKDVLSRADRRSTSGAPSCSSPTDTTSTARPNSRKRSLLRRTATSRSTSSALAVSPAFRSRERSCSRSWPSRRAGDAWFPRDNRQLVEAYAATAEDVQHRYLLTYTPTNQRRDGTWRSITVKTERPAPARARPRRLHGADGAAGPRVVRIHAPSEPGKPGRPDRR